MNVEALWRDYKQTAQPETRDALINHFIHLAKYVVDRLNVRDSGSMTKDDLIGHAILGLIDAIERYDPERGVKFESYAITRIRGTVVDLMRSLDWAPRSVRRNEREVREAYARLESVLGRPALDEEVAEELGMTVDEFQTVLADLGQTAVFSLEDSLQGGSDDKALTLGETLHDKAPNPADLAETEDMKQLLVNAVGTLPERERLVIGLYYYEGLTLKEIGKALGVTEARISQIHTKAVLKLNGKLHRFQPAFCG